MKYRLPTSTLPGVDFEYLLSDLNELVKIIESFGIKTSPTRIRRYQNYLELVISNSEDCDSSFLEESGPAFESSLDTKLYVLREVHELGWIYKGLKNNVPKGIENKLKSLVGGKVFAANDVDSTARDTQFELRIASYFCQDGYLVDLSKPTDILATKSRRTYYVECKRSKTKGSCKSNITKAAKQINRRLPKSTWKNKFFGVIAMDVTKAAYAHNGLTMGTTSEHSKESIQDELKSIAEMCLDNPKVEAQKRLLVVWLQIHIPSLVLYPNQLTTRFSSFYSVSEKARSSYASAFRQLDKVLAIGRESDERATVERLKIRKSITIPEGTKFEWDEAVFLQLCVEQHAANIDHEKIILKIHMGTEIVSIIGFHLHSLLDNISDESRQTFFVDCRQARASLAAELMMIRSPYED